MENLLPKAKQLTFHWLKLAKKERLTKSTFSLEFEIPQLLQKNFKFEAGQYVTLKYLSNGIFFQNDYSMTSAPFEGKISLGIKINDDNILTNDLLNNFEIGDSI